MYSVCLKALAVSLALIPLASASVVERATSASSAALPTGTSKANLNNLAQRKGKLYFGSATDNSEFNDTAYIKLLSTRATFGQLTPANSMKWDATEPSRGNFTFAGGDQVADLAKKNKQRLRGHNCVWHNQLPDWVEAGKFDNATLLSIIRNHCSTLVSHYKGRIYAWDVINEPFNDDGTFAKDVFFNTTGTSYITEALKVARRADPKAKLYINDFNLEFGGPKINAMVALAKSLIAAGTPLDGIGFQSHLIVGQVPTDFATQLSAITALGLEVAITEVDIRMTLPVTPALLAQQKTDYETVIADCMSVEKCIGITVWDYTDKFSWVPGAFTGQGAACPWDDNLTRKPAFDGIVAGLKSKK